MNPRKAHGRAYVAYRQDPKIVIILSTGKIVRGEIEQVQLETALPGPTGDQVAGPAEITLRVRLTR